VDGRVDTDAEAGEDRAMAPTERALPPSDDPFASPEAFMAIPRLGRLLLSPAGDRLVVSVSELDGDGGKFVTSLWELDPTGGRVARRLTRSSEGEAAFAFLPDGSLLFTSARPRPAATTGSADNGEAEAPALWLLPADGGEPFVVATRPGGITGVVTGRESWSIVVVAKTAPGTADDDASWWSKRRAKKVSAALYDRLPVRFWDQYLGPEELHLFAATVDPAKPDAELDLRDLTPDAGQALHDSDPVLTPDGSRVVVDWIVPLGRGRNRRDVAAVELDSGRRTTLAGVQDGSFDFASPAVSPDGRSAVAIRTSRSTVEDPSAVDLWLMELAAAGALAPEGRHVDIGDAPYPQAVSFSADSSALLVSADWQGRCPLFQVDLAAGHIARLTGEGAWGSVQPAPDGSSLYALRSTVDEPPRPIRLSLPVDGPVERDAAALRLLDAPGALRSLPGRLAEVTTEAEDGTALRGWLVLPEGAAAESPAPFALFVHGGPENSWNSWHWRWNPWLFAARGWAVLMPDPALSTGYGEAMIRRGWGQWGGAPFEDLMRITDAAVGRADVDGSRTAALGGSYGGYMANWIAGHTDRFGAIVSHSSVWSFEQFRTTTDWTDYWDDWGYPDTNPEFYERWSPDRHADRITTPMLVIHGDLDYRCPVGESLRLCAELTRRGVEAKFLFFREENHWILQPGDSVIWYETVLAFIDHHVLDREWRQPAGL
jgi:dipeptidyl aminopeptidase/acylaminoacyl peptidase